MSAPVCFLIIFYPAPSLSIFTCLYLSISLPNTPCCPFFTIFPSLPLTFFCASPSLTHYFLCTLSFRCWITQYRQVKVRPSCFCFWLCMEPSREVSWRDQLEAALTNWLIFDPIIPHNAFFVLRILWLKNSYPHLSPYFPLSLTSSALCWPQAVWMAWWGYSNALCTGRHLFFIYWRVCFMSCLLRWNPYPYFQGYHGANNNITIWSSRMVSIFKCWTLFGIIFIHFQYKFDVRIVIEAWV